MKNDTSKVVAPVAAKPATIAPPKTDAVLAKSPEHPAPAAVGNAGTPAPLQPSPLAATARDSVPLFGGHRGGGKKRTDGLVAGSPEAVEADKKKDAARKRDSRAKAATANLPPPLPAAPVSATGAVVPLANGASPVPVPLGVAPIVAAPTFVAWSEKILARPVKLLTKIIDRLRVASLMKRVRKLDLTEKQQKEIETDLRYKQELVDDFNGALSNCVTIELNNFQVPGAKHSHYIELVMTGGELAMTHMNAVDKLEKMILENAALKKKQATAAPPK